MTPSILTSILVLALFLSEQRCSESSENKHYLFYLHGRIIEEQGVDATSPDYGKYQYPDILNTFRSAGFTVISEARKKGTNVNEYANILTRQVQELIASGINPEDITIVGASKGSVIAMLTSSKLQNESINFVLMAACNDWVLNNYKIDLCGRILSIFEESDDIGRSCQQLFASSSCDPLTDEIQLHTGEKHGFIFKPLSEWTEPTIKWASNER